MAVVKFSKELRDAVVRQANQIFIDRISAVSSQFPSDWGAKIYDRVFGEYEEVFKTMPPELFRWDDTLAVYTNVTISCGKRVNFARNFPFPNNSLREYRIVPPAKSHMATCRYSSDTTNLDLKIDSLEWDDLRQDIIHYLDKIDAIEIERDKFVDSVRAVMDAYTTLAPALKAWPPLWDLLPNDVKERHKKVVVREKKEASLDGIDLSSMTAAVIASKIVK